MKHEQANRPAEMRSIPVRALKFHYSQPYSGCGKSNASGFVSEPNSTVAHWLIDHYPSRRQFRVVYVRPNREHLEEWIPETQPMGVEYVETTWRE